MANRSGHAPVMCSHMLSTSRYLLLRPSCVDSQRVGVPGADVHGVLLPGSWISAEDGGIILFLSRGRVSLSCSGIERPVSLQMDICADVDT